MAETILDGTNEEPPGHRILAAFFDWLWSPLRSRRELAGFVFERLHLRRIESDSATHRHRPTSHATNEKPAGSSRRPRRCGCSARGSPKPGSSCCEPHDLPDFIPPHCLISHSLRIVCWRGRNAQITCPSTLHSRNSWQWKVISNGVSHSGAAYSCTPSWAWESE
jgi:hypothetical protein